MHRRHVLLAAGVLGTVTAFGVMDAGAAPESETLVVWKLDPDWGYPRGPHGKTRLRSASSRTAAKYRYALSESDAVAMNLHKCSYAPAVPITVKRARFSTLWDRLSYEWRNPSTGEVVRIIDGRHVRRLAHGDELLAQALSGSTPEPTTPAGSPTSTSVPTAGATAPTATATGADGSISSGGSAAATSTSSGGGAPSAAAAPAADASPASLAMTGSSATAAVAVGVGAITAGIAALRLRRASVLSAETDA